MGNIKEPTENTPSFLQVDGEKIEEVSIEGIYFNELLKQEAQKFTQKNSIKDPGKCKLKGVMKVAYGVHSFQYFPLIPEVAELTITLPLPYKDVLAFCECYGEGYKDIIRKHIEAGTTHMAYDEIREELMKRINDKLFCPDKKEYKKELRKFKLDKKRLRCLMEDKKGQKLPKNLREGWK